MFGLTRREQRWKAEQKAAEVLIPAIVEITTARLAMDTNDRIAALEAELAKLRKEASVEPVAWASANVIPLRGMRDNYTCILTPFKCAANTVPLYTHASPDAERVRVLEGLLREALHICHLGDGDTDLHERIRAALEG